MPDGEKRDDADLKEPEQPEPGRTGSDIEHALEPDSAFVGTNVIPFRPRGESVARFDGDAGDIPDENGWADEDESGVDGEDGGSGQPRFPAWARRMVVAFIAIALVAQAAAILPRIYNVDVIRLLAEARNVSRDEQVQAYKAAIVVVEADKRKGTGFNIGEQGLVVTNQHVIEGSRSVVVGFEDGRVFHARVVAQDADADLALLVPDTEREERYPTLVLDAAGTWSPDDEVYYIGNPLFFRHLAGRGTLLGWANAGKSFPVLLVEAPIYPGNSGSPVISRDGRVIGVIYASAELDIGGRAVKAGLAIPASHPFFAGISEAPES